MRRELATLGVAVVLIAGCGADMPDVGPETGDGADAVELGTRDDTAPAPAGPEDEPTGPADETAGDPAGDESQTPGQPAEADASGDIETVDAGDAGEVDVRVTSANQIELVDVRPAAGWTYTVDDDDDEIEFEFRHADGRTVDVELTLDGGRVTVEID